MTALGNQREVISWLPLLKQLHQIRTPRPRQRTLINQFMFEYPEAVSAYLLHRYGPGNDLTNVEKMNRRYDVAKTLFASKYSHLTNELNSRASDEYKAELQEWSLILDNISSATDVSLYVLSLRLFLASVDSRSYS